MKIIEIYIQEVTRRLPEKMRSDIALELRSTIEDMLPEKYSEENVKDVLDQLGNPAVLANGYKDQPMQLIGPRYFDVYISLLKMIVPIAAFLALIAIVTEHVIVYSGDGAILNSILTIIGLGIGKMIEVGIQVFFWLTVIFAVIERFDKDKEPQPLTTSLEKWTADDLKNIPYIPKKKAISKLEVFGGLLWTVIWATLYFYANKLLGVYEGEAGRLEFVMPALNQEVLQKFLPIVVIIIGLEIAFALYKLLKQQWTKLMAIFNTVLEIVATIVFIIILVNPNLLNEAFILYMADLFEVTKNQITLWIVNGGIAIFIISAAIAVYDGFKRARVH
ncbi:HAAS signaling domain-containing protein [Solibacillus silvestris]|uniref:HAAS signaling domain-containing protein n=1 Tax=Solibacillus silvestris TaxID=76853 RepID=UPI003F7FC88A